MARRRSWSCRGDGREVFDTVRFTRHLEAAYTTMWETWQRGEQPKTFSVEPIA